MDLKQQTAIKCDICHLFLDSSGPVTEVKTDIYVTSFGPVSDVEMVCIQTFNTLNVVTFIHVLY